MHRAREIVLRPAADAGRVVRREVRRHDRAERRLQRKAAGKRLAAGRGMAGDAIAGGRQRLAALDLDVIVLLGASARRGRDQARRTR